MYESSQGAARLTAIWMPARSKSMQFERYFRHRSGIFSHSTRSPLNPEIYNAVILGAVADK